MVPVKKLESDVLLEGSRASWVALLRECREAMHKEGFSLDGCLARAMAERPVDESFHKEADVFGRKYQFSETNIATLGVVRWLDLSQGRDAASQAFQAGIEQLRRKKPQAFGINYLESGRLLLGIALGVAAARPRDADAVSWARGNLDSFLKKRPDETKWQILGRWAKSLLDGANACDIHDLLSRSSAAQGAELVSLLWAIERAPSDDHLTQLRCDLIGRLASLDTSDLDLMDYGMLEAVTERLAAQGARLLPVRNMEFLLGVLERFPQCVKREKHNLKDEDDVQRVLWTMLRSHFDDIVDEEYLRRFGLKNYKLDIGVRSLRTIVEAKFVRPKADLGKMQDELLADVHGYLKSTTEFDKLVMLCPLAVFRGY
jgi:hypothetical protein